MDNIYISSVAKPRMNYNYCPLLALQIFILYDVIHVRALRHNDDYVALCAMSVKTETTGAGVEKGKISANRDNLITKILLAI